MGREIEFGFEEFEREEAPKYIDIGEVGEKQKVELRVRQFREQKPIVFLVDREWTIGQVEQKLADYWGKGLRTTRLAVDGRFLPSNKKVKEVLPEIEGKVLTTVPEPVWGDFQRVSPIIKES